MLQHYWMPRYPVMDQRLHLFVTRRYMSCRQQQQQRRTSTTVFRNKWHLVRVVSMEGHIPLYRITHQGQDKGWPRWIIVDRVVVVWSSKRPHSGIWETLRLPIKLLVWIGLWHRALQIHMVWQPLSGWSYGGYMALKCLTDRPDIFHAAVSGAPVTTWTLYDTAYTERYMGLIESSMLMELAVICDVR